MVVNISPPRCLSMLTIGRHNRWNIRKNDLIASLKFVANRWQAKRMATVFASLILGHF